MLSIGPQVIIDDLLGHVKVGDDRVQQQALQRRLAVAVNGGVYTQANDGELAAAQFGDGLRQWSHANALYPGAAEQSGYLNNGALWQIGDKTLIGQVYRLVVMCAGPGYVLYHLQCPLTVDVT
jgi:hypothetical protein